MKVIRNACGGHATGFLPSGDHPDAFYARRVPARLLPARLVRYTHGCKRLSQSGRGAGERRQHNDHPAHLQLAGQDSPLLMANFHLSSWRCRARKRGILQPRPENAHCTPYPAGEIQGDIPSTGPEMAPPPGGIYLHTSVRSWFRPERLHLLGP